MAVLCPPLAEEEIIITVDNIASLRLSSYDRVPGTQVIFTCLSNITHVLDGSAVVTCLETGQWNSSQLPRCVDKRALGGGDGDIITGYPTQAPARVSEDYEMIPYLVALAALGLACLLLIVLLTYTLYARHRARDSNCSNSYDESSGMTSSQLDMWIEMAGGGPRHFRCHELASSHDVMAHELASSHDVMVHNLRYTNLHPGWSGY